MFRGLRAYSSSVRGVNALMFGVWGFTVCGHGMEPKIVSHRSAFFSAARGVAWSETAANLLKPLKGELVGPRNCLFLTHSRLQLPPVSLPLQEQAQTFACLTFHWCTRAFPDKRNDAPTPSRN